MQPRIAIVGAGISGLSAGFQLAQAGLTPVIFEKEDFVGGRMSSENVDGFIIDKGAYTLPESHGGLIKLAGSLRMQTSLTRTPGTAATISATQDYPIRIGSLTDFLKTKLLSSGNKGKMVKLFLYARSLGNSLNLTRPDGRSFRLERESAAAYLLDRYDREILERIAYPFFTELFLGTPETNSIIAFLAALRNLSPLTIFAFDRGMGSLPQRAVLDLDVRMNSPVFSICEVDQNGPYRLSVGGDKEGSHRFDAVIMALPPPLIPDLVADLPTRLAEHFRGVSYAPSVVAAFALETRMVHKSMINNFLRADFDLLGTVIPDRHKSPHRTPHGKDLVTVVLSEHGARTLFQKPDEKIVERVLEELDRFLEGFSDQVRFSRIYRWRHGALQLPPGWLYKRSAVQRSLQKGVGRLYFAGETGPVSSLEHSFRSGVRAANQVITDL